MWSGLFWSTLAWSGLVLKDSQDYLVSEFLVFDGSSDNSYGVYMPIYFGEMKYHACPGLHSARLTTTYP